VGRDRVRRGRRAVDDDRLVDVSLRGASAAAARSDPISDTAQVPNTDQDTGEVDPSLLKVLIDRTNNVALEGNAKAKGCLGVNCFPNGRGVIRVGDAVRVKKWLTA
jgi:uncharacterized protein YcbX